MEELVAKSEFKKSCNNCRYSYEAVNFSGESMGQHCNNVFYNSPKYSVCEDWGKGYCKFWELKEENK